MRIFLIAIIGSIFLISPIFGVRCSEAGTPTSIVFLTWKPNQPQVWDHLLRTFQRENPDIEVKVQIGPHSSTEYHAILAQRLKNKDASVDVFFMDVIWPPEFASAGWIADLTSRFPGQEQSKFLPGPIAANTWKGKIYGVPCFLGAGLLYYRKDLLKKYGFSPPQSWEEMLAQGRRILQGEGTPGLYIYSGQFKQYEGLVCDMLEFIWSHGGAVIDRKTGRVVLAEPPAVKAVAFVRDRIIGKAAPIGALNYEEPESLDLFIQGKAVFHRNWPYAWAIANDPSRSRIAGKVGVSPLPSFPGFKSASTLGGWQFGINRYSKHPEEAWRLIRFLTSRRAQKILALEAGLAPTRLSVYQDPDIKTKMPHLSAFLPAFEHARPRPLSPLYPMISQELQRFFSKAIINRSSDIPRLARATSRKIRQLLNLEAMIEK